MKHGASSLDGVDDPNPKLSALVDPNPLLDSVGDPKPKLEAVGVPNPKLESVGEFAQQMFLHSPFLSSDTSSHSTVRQRSKSRSSQMP